MSDPKLCFVIGPIGDAGSDKRRHADWLLKGIIQPVFNQYFPHFKVERADDISAPGAITSQIINRLHSAELVIADMSLGNPNAFYEMGIRHMTRLPTIHMFLEGEPIPFDVGHYRAIQFRYSNHDDLSAAMERLKPAVDEAIRPDFEIDNPVVQARGLERIADTASTPEKVILDRLISLEDRFTRLLAGASAAELAPVIRETVVHLAEGNSVEVHRVMREIRAILPTSFTSKVDGKYLSLKFPSNSPEAFFELVHRIRAIEGIKGVQFDP